MTAVSQPLMSVSKSVRFQDGGSSLAPKNVNVIASPGGGQSYHSQPQFTQPAPPHGGNANNDLKEWYV